VAQKKDILMHRLPRFISAFLDDRISYKSSEIHDELKNDDVTYIAYALRKKLMDSDWGDVVKLLSYYDFK